MNIILDRLFGDAEAGADESFLTPKLLDLPPTVIRKGGKHGDYDRRSTFRPAGPVGVDLAVKIEKRLS